MEKFNYRVKYEVSDEKQKLINDLVLGKEPTTPEEVKLLKQIREIEARGHAVYLPFD